MSIERFLVTQLVKDVREAVKARISEEDLEKLVIEKLNEKFNELVRQLGGVEK